MPKMWQQGEYGAICLWKLGWKAINCQFNSGRQIEKVSKICVSWVRQSKLFSVVVVASVVSATSRVGRREVRSQRRTIHSSQSSLSPKSTTAQILVFFTAVFKCVFFSQCCASVFRTWPGKLQDLGPTSWIYFEQTKLKQILRLSFWLNF